RHVEHQAEARRQRLEEPDVRHRARELDVAHALAPHLGERHLDAALLADHATVLEPLVLAADALVVLDRPEDARAEQAVALGLEGPVVDGLVLLDLAVGPRAHLLRRGEADLDRIEFLVLLNLLEQLEQRFHQYLSRSISIPSERISFTSTLKDSGIPASILWSPLTMFSYTLVRPLMSSDLTVSISCSVYAAPYASSAQTSISPKRWPPNCALPPSGCCVTSEYGPVERACILSSTRWCSFSMCMKPTVTGRSNGSPMRPSKSSIWPLRGSPASSSIALISSSVAPSNTGVANGTPSVRFSARCTISASLSDESFSGRPVPL